MAATRITPVEFSSNECADSLADANADGSYIEDYSGKEWLELQNDGGADRSVLFNSVALSNYATDVDLTFTIGAGERKKIKLPPPHVRWRDSKGNLNFTYDDVTDLKIGVFKWPE